MVKCPSCGARIGIRRLLNSDLRHVLCAQCPAILSVRTRLGMLPALMLIFLGPPAAKAVQEGWFSVASGIVGGLCVLLAAAWLGYRLSSSSLIRHRHVPQDQPMQTDDHSDSR